MRNSFQIKDIDFITYPIAIKSKKGEYYNIEKLINSSIAMYSRKSHLSTRSSQEIVLDSIIDSGLLERSGITCKIYKEVPILNNQGSYYFLDYLIPEKSLCIELDSGIHDKVRDDKRDEFLKSLGIQVLRVRDLLVEFKLKFKKILDYIETSEYSALNIDYSDLITEYESYLVNSKLLCMNLDLSSELVTDYIRLLIKKGLVTTPARIKKLLKILSMDNELITQSTKFITGNIVDRVKVGIDLDYLEKLLPRNDKKIRGYKSLIELLKSLGIDLIIKTQKLNKESDDQIIIRLHE
jgi:very-short-patch-repair endonuclease